MPRKNKIQDKIIMLNNTSYTPMPNVIEVDVPPLVLSASEAKEVIVSKKAVFKWRNELVEGRFKLTALEFHLLAALTAHIDRNAEQFEYLCVSANDLGKLLGLPLNNRFSSLEKVVKTLQKKELRFVSVAKMANGTPKTITSTNWFTSITYNYEKRTIIFEFASKLKPVLLQVTDAYVKMPVEKLLPLKRAHSNNLFLKLDVWKHKNYDYQQQTENGGKWEKPIDIIVLTDFLKEQLGIEDSYDKYKELKKSVLEPALKEINSYDGSMIVTCEPIREGRKNTKIKFTLTPIIDVETENAENTEVEPQEKTEPDKQKPAKRGRPKKVELQLTEEQQSVFDEMLLLGLRKKEAEEFIKSKPAEEIKISIEFTKNYDKAGKVKTLGGFLRTAIAEGYGVAEARAKAQEAAAAAAKKADKLANMPALQKERQLHNQAVIEQARELAKNQSSELSETASTEEETESTWTLDNANKARQLIERFGLYGKNNKND